MFRTMPFSVLQHGVRYGVTNGVLHAVRYGEASILHGVRFGGAQYFTGTVRWGDQSGTEFTRTVKRGSVLHG